MTTLLTRPAPSTERMVAIPVMAAARRRWAPARTLGRAPEILALSAAGVLLVALAYASGRAGQTGGLPLYWAGQLLVFVPVAVRILSPRLAGPVESFALVTGLALNQYLLKVCYSPDQFRFPDELQHWVSTATLVETGRLFHPNDALPAAVHFPALEEVCAALVTMTGLSITTCGLILAGVAHLVFVGALFALARRTGANGSVAGLACVIYATGAHYLFFDSMYIYQTVALPFLVLAVWASRLWQPRDRRTWPFGVLGVGSIAVVTVSHHVTAMVTVGTLGLIAACELVFGRRPRRWGPLILAVVAAAALCAWLGFVATDVISYLGAPLATMLTTARHVASSVTGVPAPAAAGPQAAAGNGSPVSSLAIQALGLLILLAVFTRAGWAVLRGRERGPWPWALVAGGVLFFAATGLRFFGAQGPELAGRAATFTYLPMSLLAAQAVMRWRSGTWRISGPPWRRGRRLATDRVTVGTLVLTLLLVGARVGGWPPAFALLPGQYLVSGYERAIDPAGVETAQWIARRIPRGQRIAADSTGWTLASTYGRLDPVGEASQLWYAPAWNEQTDRLRWGLAIRYVWVDSRLSGQTPESGAYFAQDPQVGAHTKPLAAGLLDKFDTVPGVSLVYDNGAIRLYDLGGES